MFFLEVLWLLRNFTFCRTGQKLVNISSHCMIWKCGYFDSWFVMATPLGNSTPLKAVLFHNHGIYYISLNIVHILGTKTDRYFQQFFFKKKIMNTMFVRRQIINVLKKSNMCLYHSLLNGNDFSILLKKKSKQCPWSLLSWNSLVLLGLKSTLLYPLLYFFTTKSTLFYKFCF